MCITVYICISNELKHARYNYNISIIPFNSHYNSCLMPFFQKRICEMSMPYKPSLSYRTICNYWTILLWFSSLLLLSLSVVSNTAQSPWLNGVLVEHKHRAVIQIYRLTGPDVAHMKGRLDFGLHMTEELVAVEFAAVKIFLRTRAPPSGCISALQL